MFNLSQKHIVDRPILKCDYIRYTPPSLNLVNGENNQIFIDIPREDSAISLKDSYLELDFNVTHRAGAHARYINGDHIRLVNLGPVALFNKYRLSSSSGKEIEEIDNAHVICLTHKLISSSRDSDDLSIGFHRSNEVRERELTDIKTTKGNYHVRIYLADIFGFAEHHDNCTYGLGYKLTLQRNSDNHVLSHPAQANDAANLALAGRVIIDDISWYVPHYTPSISNRKLLLSNINSKTPTELTYIKRSSFMKDVTTENNWTFELGVGDGLDVPIYVIVGFMQRDQFNQQHQNNDTFYRPSVVNAQCIIGSEKFPDAGINCNYAIDKFSQAYGEIVSCFRHLAKDNILQPYITQKDFITSNNYPDYNPGYILYVFDIRHHQDYSSPQPKKVRFDFRPPVPAATNLIGYALLLANKKISISSDGQRQFDLL